MTTPSEVGTSRGAAEKQVTLQSALCRVVPVLAAEGCILTGTRPANSPSSVWRREGSCSGRRSRASGTERRTRLVLEESAMDLRMFVEDVADLAE